MPAPPPPRPPNHSCRPGRASRRATARIQSAYACVARPAVATGATPTPPAPRPPPAFQVPEAPEPLAKPKPNLPESPACDDWVAPPPSAPYRPPPPPHPFARGNQNLCLPPVKEEFVCFLHPRSVAKDVFSCLFLNNAVFSVPFPCEQVCWLRAQRLGSCMRACRVVLIVRRCLDRSKLSINIVFQVDLGSKS